jgi:hypothetical protein
MDLSWNTLEPSLVLMYQKLVDLGWVYYNEEVHVIEPETERSDFHETSKYLLYLGSAANLCS